MRCNYIVYFVTDKGYDVDFETSVLITDKICKSKSSIIRTGQILNSSEYLVSKLEKHKNKNDNVLLLVVIDGLMYNINVQRSIEELSKGGDSWKILSNLIKKERR